MLDGLTPEQNKKAQLALLSFYLQTPPLPDELLLLYASDLSDLSPSELAFAIEALKRDESVWTGRFPLPGKIRSYLHGSTEERAIVSARKIMDVRGYQHARDTLSSEEYKVASQYGLQAIFEREPSKTSMIFAHIRDILKSTYAVNAREALEMEMKVGLPDYLKTIGTEVDRPESATVIPSEPSGIQEG